MSFQPNLSRRHVLIGGSALMLASACGSPSVASGKIDKIGIQTYTLRDALGEDFVGTFQMIKDVGYDYVELNSRNFSDQSPADLRKILDDIGLPAPASHVDYDSLASAPEALGDTASRLGCKYVILPWIADDQRGLDDYKRHAAMLNLAGEALKSFDVRVAYHNHQFEFFDLGGEQNGMDILLSETDEDKVYFQLDLFWASLAGIDIGALFNAHSGRFKLCHIKDMKGDPEPWRTRTDYEKIVGNLMVNVGEGDLPFEDMFALNDVSGMEYFIAEHDFPPKPYRQSIQTSYNTIKAMRF